MSTLSRLLGLDRAKNRKLRAEIDTRIGNAVTTALVNAGVPFLSAVKMWERALRLFHS